ncbi:MAG: helix-turn-helix domain-containing protein [Sphingopyxis sp.]|nr:helix-turn-helix domain-containing protein [Sphingopyxis sp.]
MSKSVPAKLGKTTATTATRIDSFGFRGADMDADANAAAWQEAVSPLFAVDELGRGEPGRFEADLESYAMGPMLLGCARFSGQRFSRSMELIAHSGVDHIMVQIYLSGGFEGVAGSLPIVVNPGDICVFDLGQPFETRAIKSTNLTFVAPRILLDPRLPQPELLHGLVLKSDNVLTSLLGRHLVALFDHASHMTFDEAVAASQGTVALAVACMRGELERRDALLTEAYSHSLVEVRRYIDQQLASEALSVDSIATKFAMSRATLYRLFEPVGGVAAFIRARRLHRAFLELSDPRKRVSEVARRWHFSSEAVFARAFKSAYGISPSVARGPMPSKGANTSIGAEQNSPVIERWMRDLVALGKNDAA